MAKWKIAPRYPNGVTGAHLPNMKDEFNLTPKEKMPLCPRCNHDELIFVTTVKAICLSCHLSVLKL